LLKQLWQESVASRARRVACLGGTIGPDTVWITAAAPVTATADSLSADAAAALAQCAPPRWIGTVHHPHPIDRRLGAGRSRRARE